MPTTQILLIICLLSMMGNFVIAQNTEWVYDTISTGETLEDIVETYNVSVTDLKKWNKAKTINKLKPGSVIRMPASGLEIVKNEEAEDSTASRSLTSAASYTVKAGDTFYSIAQRNNLSVDALLSLNPGANGTSLYIGQQLSLGAESSSDNRPSDSSDQPNVTDFSPKHDNRFNFKQLEAYKKLYSQIAEIKREYRTYAVVIGVSDYPNVKKLRYPDDDAYAFYAHLMSPEGGACGAKQISILVDENATKANILQAIREKTAMADENDRIIFYYAGHGIQHALIPYDYDGTNPLTFEELALAGKGVKTDHRISFIDACHSGSISDNISSGHTGTRDDMIFRIHNTMDHHDNWALLSSTAEEESIEIQGVRHGLFTYALIDGFRGAADLNNDNMVTLGEVYDHLNTVARKYSGGRQHPLLLGSYDLRKVLALVRND